jgi:DNA gyrase subunit A
MTILSHFDATPDERTAFIKMSRAMRGEAEDNSGDAGVPEIDAMAVPSILSQERYVEMSAAEQVVLAISQNGYGKRSSSFEYRVAGRGGKGIAAMSITEKTGPIVASFPVENDDTIMLVTDGGKLIRVPVDGIRLAGRATQGVIVLDTAKNENVVSVERISEPEPEPEDDEDTDEGEGNGETGEGGEENESGPDNASNDE